MTAFVLTFTEPEPEPVDPYAQMLQLFSNSMASGEFLSRVWPVPFESVASSCQGCGQFLLRVWPLLPRCDQLLLGVWPLLSRVWPDTVVSRVWPVPFKDMASFCQGSGQFLSCQLANSCNGCGQFMSGCGQFLLRVWPVPIGDVASRVWPDPVMGVANSC